jgi:hypothetical protein
MLNPPKALKDKKNSKLWVASSRLRPSSFAFARASVAYVEINLKRELYGLSTRMNGNGNECRNSCSIGCGRPILVIGISWGAVHKLAYIPPLVPGWAQVLLINKKKDTTFAKKIH